MYLLDTNVVSELRKCFAGRGHPNVTSWASRLPSSTFFLSAITIQEIEIGILRAERHDPRQGALLRAWLEGHILPDFVGRIHPIDTLVARRSARLVVPDPKPYRDVLIAATALIHGLTVVTRNLTDFTSTGVSLLNPWD